MSDDPYKTELFSGYALLAFMTIVGLMGLFYLRPTLSHLETPAAKEILQGTWPLQFEKTFRSTLPVDAASRSLWGRGEYALFNQGRKGVIAGMDGWLFTDEEFSCPRNTEENLTDNLTFINQVRNTLARENVRLVVTLIPAKVRVLPEALGLHPLPLCRENLYQDIRASLIKNGTVVTDLLPAIQTSPVRKDIYLKTDTHWSPVGAALAAQMTADLVHTRLKDIDLRTERFSSQAGSIKAIEGDLTSYVPGAAFPPEHIASYVSGVSVASLTAPQNLFNDDVPLVTLVGTSYSANPNWNFVGFLKESLKTDVLNMADQGLGPFVVMDKYLQNSAWKDTPPQLVIWEMPERYFLMPHGVASAGI